MRSFPRFLRRCALLIGSLALLAACTTTDRGRAPALERQATWAVLPFANHTETPLAGNRAEAIAEALLHAQGVGRVLRHQPTTQQEALFDAGDIPLFVVGGVASFVSALVAVRTLIKYLSRHDYTVFAWYRIVFGGLVLATAYFGVIDWGVGH